MEVKKVQIQTYSVLVGTKDCNASCPFCVSQMTPSQGMENKIEPHWRNFEIGCRFAKDSGVSTVLLTGKGEPTLFPAQITDFLEHLKSYGFPFIELQTNGILLGQRQAQYEAHLSTWYGLGLTTVAVSIVDWHQERNQAIIQPNGDYVDLTGLIANLHALGLSVRLSCTMFRGIIDSQSGVERLISFAQEHQVEQLSIRPVEMPHRSENPKVAQWVSEHKLNSYQLESITAYVQEVGTKLMRLPHGAVVYDIGGQNLCLTNCLTLDPSSDEVRQLIFFPDGHLRYDWQYPGAILL